MNKFLLILKYALVVDDMRSSLSFYFEYRRNLTNTLKVKTVSSDMNSFLRVCLDCLLA
jgi:hypothetical protein